jgi:tRNA A-37 threonylcarbamoyl transferase component Bud32
MIDALLIFIMAASLFCWAVAELHAFGKRRRAKRYRIDRVDPRCERSGSQEEFLRRIRAGGVR